MRTCDASKKLRRIMHRATAADYVEGQTWYDRAHDIARELSERYYLSLETVAAVIAVLSTNNKWSRNLFDAEEVIKFWCNPEEFDYEPPKVCTYSRNLAKAFKILDGDLSACHGPKHEAFAANIRGDHDCVTLDIWATRAVGGGDSPANKTARAAIQAAYRKVAAEFGMSPAALQAVVWVIVRNANSNNYAKGFTPATA